MTVRAFYRAVTVDRASAPYNTVTLKVYYPAASDDSHAARNTGVMAADKSKAPFPIIILMPGINVGLGGYQWLAVALAEQNMVVVTYSWIAEEMPGYISLTPGIDLTAVRPNTYGQKPTCPALAPILAALADWQESDRASKVPTAILAGLLDLDTIILGGHSAGGTMALHNASPVWFSGIKGAFSYAGHTMTATFFGYGAGTILPVVGTVPLLLLGGSRDGVIEASAHRYNLPLASATLPLERTFAEAVTGGRGDVHLVILEGANHFSCVYPVDETTGRPFLDHPTTMPDTQLRETIAHLIGNFIAGTICQQPDKQAAFEYQVREENPLIALHQSK